MKALSPKRDPFPTDDERAHSQNSLSVDVLESHFEDLRGELLGTVYYTVGNIDDARDVVQESFLKCWRNRHQVAEVTNLRAWIFRITLNTARDMRKASWNRRRTSWEGSAEMAAESFHPAGEIVRQEEMQTLRVAIEKLRPEEREVFLLRQNGELTYEQIGETLSLAVGTVKTRMRAALTHLRVAVGETS